MTANQPHITDTPVQDKEPAKTPDPLSPFGPVQKWGRRGNA